MFTIFGSMLKKRILSRPIFTMKIIVWQSSLKIYISSVDRASEWNMSDCSIIVPDMKLYWYNNLVLTIYSIYPLNSCHCCHCASRLLEQDHDRNRTTTICFYRAETYHVENLILCLVHSAVLRREGKRDKEKENVRWRKHQCEHPPCSSNISILQI